MMSDMDIDGEYPALRTILNTVSKVVGGTGIGPSLIFQTQGYAYPPDPENK